MENTDPLFLETSIVQYMLMDKHFAGMCANSFIPEYFDFPEVRKIFEFVSSYLKEYSKVPSQEIVENSVENSEHIIGDLNVKLSEDYDWLLDQTDKYLQDKAMKKAIMDSVNLLESKEDPAKVRNLIEGALCKNLKIDLGINYWKDLGERLEYILKTNDERIKTYFPTLDDLLAGGFPRRGILGCFTSKTFGGKSLSAINLGIRQSKNGENVVIFTLEMDEYAYCNRADGIFSGLDVNRIYTNKDSIKKLISELKKVKEESSKGNLIIKDFPSGTATVGNLIVFLRELEIRGIKPTIVYVDYINIMKGAYRENSYLNIKTLAEELRAMAAMFGIPIITFSQLNREGGRMPLQDLGLGYISESKALEDTADFLAIIGVDEDSITYENMLFWMVIKNRISGRKGTIPVFVDMCSLKMYDEIEIDTWLMDSSKSGDSRNIYERRT